MSARERLLAALAASPEIRPGEAEQLVAETEAEALLRGRKAILKDANSRFKPSRPVHLAMVEAASILRDLARAMRQGEHDAPAGGAA
jgi:hypothetical protein